MDKSIEFDIDYKHALACLGQAGQPDHYANLRPDNIADFMRFRGGARIYVGSAGAAA